MTEIIFYTGVTGMIVLITTFTFLLIKDLF